MRMSPAKVFVLPSLGRTFRPVQQKNSAAEEKSSDCDTNIILKMLSHFDQIKSKNIIYTNLSSAAEIFWPLWQDYLEKGW
jgi:hypothetical protein